MICKQCKKEFYSSEGHILGKLCSYTCKNIYYDIHKTGQKIGKNIPKKAIIFVLYYYYGIKIRRLEQIKNILKEVPYLIQNEQFKNEINKCLK